MKRLMKKRSNWDGVWKAKCEVNGNIDTNGSTLSLINIDWGTPNGAVAAVSGLINNPEYLGFANRFREYKIQGFSIEINLIKS